MGPDLRSRLRRIRELRKTGAGPVPPEGPPAGSGGAARKAGPTSPAPGPEWSPAGSLVFKRLLRPEPPPELPAALSAALPAALSILIPDLIPYGREQGPPELSDLLFFDLETTGLSGGAGTVAFLAALGRFVREPGSPAAGPRFRVGQYLLTDYPGEGDFLAAVLAELEKPAPSGRPPLIVTYNGKTFDAQILKIRCLMNGLRPPAYYHADLLHPCRRLWKRALPGCSQGEIETAVLGLDRTGDVPGALAPDIWFSFLKTGVTAELLNICEHNVRDITGLAGIFAALIRIAEDPATAPETYRVDPENLALHWFYACRRRGPFREAVGPEQRLADELLTLAADRACPRAACVWAQELFRRGRAEEGRRRLRALTTGKHPGETKAAACRLLAVDAEWRLRDLPLALSYTEFFLSLKPPQNTLKKDMTKRRERLLAKLAKNKVFQ